MGNLSFKAFMLKIIDYAGMFPPANLDLETAYKNYLNYVTCPDSWMISKFVCNVNVLNELSSLHSKLKKDYNNIKSDNWINISVLLTGGNSPKEFLSNLINDVEIVKTYLSEHIEDNIIDTFEVKVPEEFFSKSNSVLKNFIQNSYEIFNDSGLFRCKLFLEPPINSNSEYVFNKLSNAIAECNHLGDNAGFKLRTGGITQDVFPSVEQISLAIKITNECKIPIKATAGLHLPIRHFDENIGTMMHGFFNFFGSAILNCKNNLSLKEIREILNDEKPENFKFNKGNFSWNDITIDTESIFNIRDKNVISFGSCSFDEPRDDLKNLGLM